MAELKTMNCLRCSEDVQEVWLTQAFDIEEKTKNIKGLFKRKTSPATVFVCPACGHIEFIAEKPEVFRKR